MVNPDTRAKEGQPSNKVSTVRRCGDNVEIVGDDEERVEEKQRRLTGTVLRPFSGGQPLACMRNARRADRCCFGLPALAHPTTKADARRGA